MTTAQNITIQRGATFSTDLTVTSTAGKSYAAKIAHRWWSSLIDLTCTVADGTTVTISLTATQTANLALPAQIGRGDREALLGYWDMVESDGSTVTRTHQGSVTISREATR